MSNKDVYEQVFGGLIEQMKSAGQWIMPWEKIACQPCNTEGRAYRGLNRIVLAVSARQQGFGSPVWGTYRAWKNAGGQVRRGQKGTKVACFNTREIEEDGEAKKVFFARSFTVFNAAQVEGAEKAPASEVGQAPGFDGGEAEALALLTRAADSLKVGVTHGGNSAFYSPKADRIVLPAQGQFYDSLAYVATLAHELGHATASRLGRDLAGTFGSPAYAFEELVAEMTAAFVLGAFGLCKPEREDHAAYLRHWLAAVQDHGGTALARAASMAQAAADMILEHGEEVAAQAAA